MSRFNPYAHDRLIFWTAVGACAIVVGGLFAFATAADAKAEPIDGNQVVSAFNNAGYIAQAAAMCPFDIKLTDEANHTLDALWAGRHEYRAAPAAWESGADMAKGAKGNSGCVGLLFVLSVQFPDMLLPEAGE